MSGGALHPLLRRQLRRLLGGQEAGIDALPEDPVLVARLLELVSEAYATFDQDNRLIEHSLDLTSSELVEKNRRLAEDLAQQKELEARLHDKQRRLDFQRERMPLGFIEWDAEGRVVEWNPSAEALFGWTREEMMGQTSTERIVHPSSRPLTRGVVDALMAGTGGYHSINENRHRDGSALLCEWFNTTLVDDDGNITGVASLVRDVTERVRWEEDLLRASRLDGLTQLPNRRFFIESLDRALANFRRYERGSFAILFIDLDRFKQVNDSLGHSAGDVLLQEVAQRLQRCLREGDLVARLGGDEFAVLLMGASEPVDAMRTAERLSEAIQRPVTIQGRTLLPSASIGVAQVAERFACAEDMLRDADIAMYRAKVQGHSRITLFDRAMYEEVRDRIELEGDLRLAVDRNELRLVFQPVIRLRDGALTGLEALLRWDHPERGSVSPAQFIPLAEESGSIVEIGSWVVAQATRRMAEWQAELPEGAWMSVNLTARQLVQPDLLDVLQRHIRANRLAPEQLAVEISETSMVRGDEARAAITSLSLLGVRTLMDDFGTGYASLANLVNYDVDLVKIDRTFVLQAADHGRDFLRSILQLAHSLGKQTVAEGVETIEQLDLVSDLGTHFGQGYLLAYPMRPEEVLPWHRSRTQRRPVLVKQAGS